MSDGKNNNMIKSSKKKISCLVFYVNTPSISMIWNIVRLLVFLSVLTILWGTGILAYMYDTLYDMLLFVAILIQEYLSSLYNYAFV